MTPYYKELECSNFDEINQQVKDYVWSTGIVETTDQFWNALPTIEFIKSTPAFYKWLSGLGLKLHSLALTVGKNNDCCGPHIDTPPAAHKLSWPIQNTENTYNRWFIPAVDNPTYRINFNGGKSFEQNELVELARREVTTPCIINASMIHDVWCNDQAQYPRLGLQCMLFEEPEL
jgi:hypothetical protein